MVHVDQGQPPHPTAGQGLCGPRPHAANANHHHMGRGNALCSLGAIQALQRCQPPVDHGGGAQSDLSKLQIWYLNANHAPMPMPKRAVMALRLRVEMPLTPCPMVHPMAVTPPTPINTAPTK